MKDGGVHGQVMQYMTQIFQVIMTVATSEEDEEVLNPTTGLLGDLAQIYGAQIKPLLQQHNAQGALNNVIIKCQRSDDQETKDIANFAMEQVKLAMA